MLNKYGGTNEEKCVSNLHCDNRACSACNYRGGGCQLSLDDEDEREQVEIDKNGYAKHVLTESTAVSGVTTSSGLTLVFQTTGTVADDQLILFKGTSNSKTVTVRTGFLGDWAVWDTGINDASATDGTLKDGNFNVMKNGFTGNDGCAFVFKVDSDTTNSIYYYINGELALAWEKVTTTFCAALIDALSTNGLSFIDNSDSTSSTLAMSGNVYYIASAVDSDTAKTLSAKPSTTTSTSTTVSEKSIVSLALSGLADSKVYYNPAAMKNDLVVTATYSDNTTVTLSASEYTITKNTAGTGIVVTSTANTSVSKEYAGFVYTQEATTVTDATGGKSSSDCTLAKGKTAVATYKATSKNTIAVYDIWCEVWGNSGVTMRMDNWGWNYGWDGAVAASGLTIGTTNGGDLDKKSVEGADELPTKLASGVNIKATIENGDNTVKITLTSEDMASWKQTYTLTKVSDTTDGSVLFHFNTGAANSSIVFE